MPEPVRKRIMKDAADCRLPTADFRLILGIDPGLNRCGWGVIASEGSRLAYVAHGVIKPPVQQQLASRLHDVFEGICSVIAEHAPHEAAVEETFVNANARAALALGQARGVALAAA